MRLTYLAYYAYLGIFTPYISLWLDDAGFASGAIARTTAFVMLATTVGQLLLPPILLKWRLHHVAVGAAAGAVTTAAAMAISDTAAAITIFAIMSGIFCGALLPLVDALALARSTAGWGSMRAFGSLGFAVASIMGGVMIDNMGAASIPLALVVALAFACAGIALTRVELPRPRTSAGVTVGTLLTLVRRHDLCLLVLAVAAIKKYVALHKLRRSTEPLTLATAKHGVVG